jgi:hypothetical protein
MENETIGERLMELSRKNSAAVMLSFNPEGDPNTPPHLRMTPNARWQLWIGLQGRRGIFTGPTCESVMDEAECANS